MKIAVLVDGRNVAKDIEQTKELHICDIDNMKITNQIKIDITEGGGYQGLLYILYNEGVEVAFCGNITDEQRQDFGEYDVKVFSDVKGAPNKVVSAYMKYLKQQK